MKVIVAALAVGWIFSSPVLAQNSNPTPAAVGLDCWVGRDGPPFFTNFIRCMVDRDLPYPTLADQQLDAFLGGLHTELHSKSGADAERMYKANIELVRESISVWNIRIFSYPYEWSWEEGRPQQLVRSVLCPRDVSCTVNVYPR
jgi:hypothetical protein